jgi:putative Holliday junction resolvase
VATVDAEDPWDRIAALVAEYEPVAVVVGYPLDLRGEPGPAAVKMESRAEDLAGRLDIPVWLADERLSTGEAARKLHLAGRNARQQRGIVDQAAAVAILEGVLAAERAGHLPGHPAAAVTKEDS